VADDLATALKELARLGDPGPTEGQVLTAVRLLGAYGWDALDVDDVLGRVPKAFTDDLAFCSEQAGAGNPLLRAVGALRRAGRAARPRRPGGRAAARPAASGSAVDRGPLGLRTGLR
jgi:hypothetical protein